MMLHHAAVMPVAAAPRKQSLACWCIGPVRLSEKPWTLRELLTSQTTNKPWVSHHNLHRLLADAEAEKSKLFSADCILKSWKRLFKGPSEQHRQRYKTHRSPSIHWAFADVLKTQEKRSRLRRIRPQARIHATKSGPQSSKLADHGPPQGRRPN